jgi:2-dehydropantoate 2-reductase
MLQDVELGRSLETEALVGSILELARLTETPAPRYGKSNPISAEWQLL